MSYSYSFFDNQNVGADDLNKLVKLFVTGGVADNFANGVPYSVEKLNDVVYANANSGVVPASISTLKVSVAGNTAYIEPGTAFFNDGTVITVESREQLNITQGAHNYVYLKSSLAENRAYPMCSTSAPSGNFVPLAEIDASGVVTDKRVYAKGKVPSFYTSDSGLSLKKTFIINRDDEKIKLFDDINNYKFLVTRVFRKPSAESTRMDFASVGFLNLETSDALSFSMYSPKEDRDARGMYNTEGLLKLGYYYSASLGARSNILGQAVKESDGTYMYLTNNASSNLEIDVIYRNYIFPYELEVYAF